MVAGAVEAHRDAGMVADDADRHARIGAIGADLLGAEQRAEGGEGRGEGDHAAGGHAGGGRDHVLLGDAEVEEALRMARLEFHRAVGGGEVGGQHDDARVAVGEVGELLAEHEGRHRRGGRALDRAAVLELRRLGDGAGENLALVLARRPSSSPSGRLQLTRLQAGLQLGHHLVVIGGRQGCRRAS